MTNFVRVTIRHPALREFDRTRVAANNATEAVVIGLRLGRAGLDGLDPSDLERPLKELTRVEGTERLDVTGTVAMTQLTSAETYLPTLTIPFAVAVLNEFLVEVLRILQGSGITTSANPDELMLGPLRSVLTSAAQGGLRVDPQAEAAMSFVQVLRNEVIHSGGRITAKLRTRWEELGGAGRDRWNDAARRDFAISEDFVALGLGEMRATWATCKGYAEAVNSALGDRLPSIEWARIATADWRSERPHQVGDVANAAENALKYAKTRYADVEGLGLADFETVAGGS